MIKIYGSSLGELEHNLTKINNKVVYENMLTDLF